MQSLLEPEDPPVAVALRRHVLPSQHWAAMGLPLLLVETLGLETHSPVLFTPSPSSTQTPKLGKAVGCSGGGGGGADGVPAAPPRISSRAAAAILGWEEMNPSLPQRPTLVRRVGCARICCSLGAGSAEKVGQDALDLVGTRSADLGRW